MDECDSFPAWFALSEAYAVKGKLGEALSIMKKAVMYSGSKEEKAMAFLAMARMCRENKRPDEAIASYKNSLELNRNMEVERELMEMEREGEDSIVSSEKIVAALQKGLHTRAFGVVPSIDIRVNFEYGSAALSEKGRRQADELGKALASDSFKDMRFKVIGHTDSRGSADYNQRLSKQRAETVKGRLLQNFGVRRDRITAEGKGESELLYHDDTEEAHALNRRVEVKLF